MKKVSLSAKKKWALWGALGVLIIVVTTSTAYAIQYAEIALPRVTVGGISVTGMTHSQVTELVEDRAAETTVTATVDEDTTTVPLAEAGVVVDGAATADAVFAFNGPILSRLTAPFIGHAVPIVYTVKPSTFNDFSEQVSSFASVPLQNGEVQVSESGDYFIGTEAKAGQGIDTELVDKVVNLAAQTLIPQEVTLKPMVLEPNVTTQQAQRAAEQANELLDVTATLNGTVSVNPSTVEDVVKWVTVPTLQQGLGDPFLDPKKIKTWVHKTAQNTNDAPIPGIENVDENGNVVATSKPGTPGATVKNLDQITEEAIDALTSGKSYEGQLTYKIVEQTMEQRQVLPGTEKLPYRPHKGEKWIDINLSNFTVTAYEGTTVVNGPISAVMGRPGATTVTGIYNIYLKYEKQTMRGVYPNGTKYDTSDVPWVMYFHGGYALHGAYWRTSFGYAGPTGSNGCVNLPVDAAKWFYHWSELNTVVASHTS